MWGGDKKYYIWDIFMYLIDYEFTILRSKKKVVN